MPIAPAATRARRYGLPVGVAADLQRVRAVDLGHPHHEAVLAEHARQPVADPRLHREGAARAVAMGEPVNRAADLDRAALPGLVAGQPADVLGGRDQPRRPARHRGRQLDLQPPRPGRVEAVQQPQLAPAHVDDPAPVGAGLPRVRSVVIGVPPQVAAGLIDRVDVGRAFVVGQEREPVPRQHRAGEVAGETFGYPAERPVAGPQPQPAGGAAPVPLAPGRIAGAAGEQPGRAILDGDLAEHPETELARARRRRICAHRVRALPEAERLAGRRHGQHLVAGSPAAHPHPRVAPVRQPATWLARDVRHVDLGSPVSQAGPGHPAAVARQPRPGSDRVIRGQPPGPAAVGRSQPHVILGDEGQEVTLHMRKAQISR